MSGLLPELAGGPSERTMKRDKQTESPLPGHEQAACPWDDLDESGSALTVDDFLTTLISHAGNALRRTITLPYAEQFGLSVSEWRMLSVLAQARQLPFAELVRQSATDKAQVSRTLRLLESRDLVAIQAEGLTPRKKLTCLITQGGLALYGQVMPLAQRRQAAMIRQLSAEERGAVYRALKKLRALCASPDGEGD